MNTLRRLVPRLDVEGRNDGALLSVMRGHKVADRGKAIATDLGALL